METQDSLNHRISAGLPLTESEQAAIAEIVGSGCRAEKKGRIARALARCPHLENFGIFNRVLLERGGAHYCAGQDYPSEIRTVRECLVGR